jgi:hypothetical protein
MRLAIFFKDFAHWVRSSCVGLNVAGYTTAKYLRGKGIDAEAFAVRHNVDVVKILDKARHQLRPFTHVVISAPWLTLHDLKSLIRHFHHTKFAVLSHSNIGFLQADPNAIKLFRLYAEFSETVDNFMVGGNNYSFVHWFRAVYNENCVLLPNLYPIGHIHGKRWNSDVLNIGAFGAIRPEKNFMTAAAAALVIQNQLNVPLRLHMSTGGDGCKSTTLPAIEEMVEGLPSVELIKHDWDSWDRFIKLIGKMDLLLQLSYTESFNMITADGISVGVPSVVSPVIRWAPEQWKAEPDNVVEVAEVGIRLLLENQGHRGERALNKHNERGFPFWKHFLAHGIS